MPPPSARMAVPMFGEHVFFLGDALALVVHCLPNRVLVHRCLVFA